METVATGIRERAATQYDTALQHLTGVDVDGSPEALHQYRVHLRKARSLLTLYRDALADTPAALLAQLLGEQARAANLARDLDVFWPSLDPGALKDEVGRLRQRTYRIFHAEAEQQQRDRELALWLLKLSWPCDGRVLAPETERVRQHLKSRIEHQCQRLLNRSSTPQWHRLRILIKRWRYLETLCGEPSQLALLKEGQTLLGDFNDLCSQRILLKPLQAGKGKAARQARQYRAELKAAQMTQKNALDDWIQHLLMKNSADAPIR
ncbi:CHAD domain containing protein [Ferrimonas balearica DSM 9799]|uniref:CHAD domain containing protein n=1 Tax=Ferrimonas balearica (strain DSM 9799 / CCM 4581 / KCTC 23876 / PAT) TaxID=550540 RepID=E1SM22_FERBD|nr:CHAD domain-containing protein [Ferrimonas balearica]ADN76540.1 CHAD domain containing protein [Ferrimonas balearica DSM 9799]